MIALVTISLFAAAGPRFQDPEPAPSIWTTDWVAAKARAAKEHKSLLVDFTGSDWCAWCQRLDAEVFGKSEFEVAATPAFVLVKIDFPEDRSGQSPELIAQNDRLATEYHVQGFPTILLMDAEGRPFAQTGYREGGVEPYLEHLSELRAIGEQRDALVEKAKAADSIEKAKLLAEAIEVVPVEFHSHYTDWMDQVIALDADGAAGLRQRYELRKQIIVTRTAMTSALESKDFVGAAKLIDEFLDAHDEQLDAQTKHEYLYYRGIAAANAGEPEIAIEKLQAAKQVVPGHPMNEAIDQKIVQIRRAIEARGAAGATDGGDAGAGKKGTGSGR